MRDVRISEIEPIRIAGGTIAWRPVRRTLGIRAFGINAYTADAGKPVVETHDETGLSAGHHEEVYAVISGRAIFTVSSVELDAPTGTLVFLDDPKEKRGAVAVEDGTTVLAIGGVPGQAFSPSPWEYAFSAIPAITDGRWAEAATLIREGFDQHPGNASLLYELACVEAQAGAADAALDHLEGAVSVAPKFREYAATDDDLAALRDKPRFNELVGPRA